MCGTPAHQEQPLMLERGDCRHSAAVKVPLSVMGLLRGLGGGLVAPVI